MSKPVKNLMIESYKRRFENLDSAVMIDIRGIAANDNNALRTNLAGKQMRVTVVKNTLARRAWANTPLQGLCELLDGSCAVVTGGESAVNIARMLIDQAREVNLEFKGAVMEGAIFGPDDVSRLSKFPTREEAQGQLIQICLAPAGQIIGAATSAGAQIASILASIEEKLEKGEEIGKTG